MHCNRTNSTAEGRTPFAPVQKRTALAESFHAAVWVRHRDWLICLRNGGIALITRFTRALSIPEGMAGAHCKLLLDGSDPSQIQTSEAYIGIHFPERMELALVQLSIYPVYPISHHQSINFSEKSVSIIKNDYIAQSLSGRCFAAYEAVPVADSDDYSKDEFQSVSIVTIPYLIDAEGAFWLGLDEDGQLYEVPIHVAKSMLMEQSIYVGRRKYSVVHDKVKADMLIYYYAVELKSLDGVSCVYEKDIYQLETPLKAKCLLFLDIMKPRSGLVCGSAW